MNQRSMLRYCGVLQLCILVSAALCSGVQPARADNELQVYGVNNFGGKGQCLKSDATHSVHTKTGLAFQLPFLFSQAIRIVTGNGWDSVNTINNKSVSSDLFTDALFSGQDNLKDKGADEADVIYVHTHGGSTTIDKPSVDPPYSYIFMGTSSSACSAKSDKMYWDLDLDIAVIKACEFLQREVWEGGAFNNYNFSNNMRLINGFHGDSTCGDHVVDYVGRYAWESFDEGVGDNWLDEAYCSGCNEDDTDDCPVSIAIGDSETTVDRMYHHGGWLDRKSFTTPLMSTYYYMEGCDPPNGSALPD